MNASTPQTRVLGVRDQSCFVRRFAVSVIQGSDRGTRVVSEADELSIGTDEGNQSVLFTGDAEEKEEDLITVKAATLLQVGHHGSNTSSLPAFLKQIEPKYAVMSPGKPFKGTNVTYCHPVKKTIDSLNAAMGGPGSATIRAFNGKDNGPTCRNSTSNPADWSYALTVGRAAAALVEGVDSFALPQPTARSIATRQSFMAPLYRA